MIHTHWVGVKLMVGESDWTGLEGETDLFIHRDYFESPSGERTSRGTPKVEMTHRAFSRHTVAKEVLENVDVVVGVARFKADTVRVVPTGYHRGFSRYELTATGRELTAGG